MNTKPTLRSFDELRLSVDQMLMWGAVFQFYHAPPGYEYNVSCEIPEELADDPHVAMLLTWMEMQT